MRFLLDAEALEAMAMTAGERQVETGAMAVLRFRLAASLHINPGPA